MPSETGQGCSVCISWPSGRVSFQSYEGYLRQQIWLYGHRSSEQFQTAKYFLKSKGSTAVCYFTRQDILHTPVSTSLVKNICSSAKRYKKELRDKQVKLDSELNAVALSRRHMAFQTGAAAKRLREKAVKQSQ